MQSVHRVRHPADGGREPQVLPQPRGVRLRLPEPLPGHRQPLHVSGTRRQLTKTIDVVCLDCS